MSLSNGSRPAALSTMPAVTSHRGRTRQDVSPRVATLPADIFRHELFRTRNPPSERVIAEIIDEVFLPLMHP